MAFANPKKVFFLILLILSISQAALGNTEYRTKAWLSIDILKTLPCNDKIVYQLSGQHRSDISEPFLDRYNLQTGVGYQIVPSTIVWFGYQLLTRTQRVPNNLEHRLWQQMVWVPIDNPCFNFALRSRLEERKREAKSQLSTRFRERLIVRFPSLINKKSVPVLFNEVFLNVNNPKWISTNKLVDQNRLFVGFDVTLSKTQAIEVGYMNIRRWRNNNNQIDHVLMVDYIFS